MAILDVAALDTIEQLFYGTHSPTRTHFWIFIASSNIITSRKARYSHGANIGTLALSRCSFLDQTSFCEGVVDRVVAAAARLIEHDLVVPAQFCVLA